MYTRVDFCTHSPDTPLRLYTFIYNNGAASTFIDFQHSFPVRVFIVCVYVFFPIVSFFFRSICPEQRTMETIFVVFSYNSFVETFVVARPRYTIYIYMYAQTEV